MSLPPPSDAAGAAAMALCAPPHESIHCPYCACEQRHRPRQVRVAPEHLAAYLAYFRASFANYNPSAFVFLSARSESSTPATNAIQVARECAHCARPLCTAFRLCRGSTAVVRCGLLNALQTHYKRVRTPDGELPMESAVRMCEACFEMLPQRIEQEKADDWTICSVPGCPNLACGRCGVSFLYCNGCSFRMCGAHPFDDWFDAKTKRCRLNCSFVCKGCNQLLPMKEKVRCTSSAYGRGLCWCGSDCYCLPCAAPLRKPTRCANTYCSRNPLCDTKGTRAREACAECSARVAAELTKAAPHLYWYLVRRELEDHVTTERALQERIMEYADVFAVLDVQEVLSVFGAAKPTLARLAQPLREGSAHQEEGGCLDSRDVQVFYQRLFAPIYQADAESDPSKDSSRPQPLSGSASPSEEDSEPDSDQDSRSGDSSDDSDHEYGGF